MAILAVPVLLAVLFGFAGWTVNRMQTPAHALQIPEDFYRPDLVQPRLQPQMVASLPDGENTPDMSAAEENLALRQKIETHLATFPKEFKPYLYFEDLQSGSFVDIHADEPVAAASVIKLPILLEYFKRVDSGKITPYTHLMAEDFEQAGGSGMIQYRKAGHPFLAKDVAQLMIQSSDNTCTNMLVYHFGGMQELNESFALAGLTGTQLSNWLPDLGGTNTITMRDMAKVLQDLTSGDVLSQESQTAARAILEGTHNRRLLPALLPHGTKIAHKTGDIGSSLGNSGIVTTPSGRRYIVAIQVERPHNRYEAKTMISEVSKLIYDDVVSHSSPVVASANPAKINAPAD